MFFWKIYFFVYEKDIILLYVVNNFFVFFVRLVVWFYYIIKINVNEYIIFYINNWVLRICFGLNFSEEI